MAVIYSDYSRARIGWFFGLSGWQLAIVCLALLPIAWSVQAGAWPAAALLSGLWILIVLVTITPVRGRSTLGWAGASLAFAAGGLAGWTRFASRAAAGRAGPAGEPDLPGILHGIRIHEGPPAGAGFTRTAIIQDHRAKTWAVTAALVHPGIGLTEPAERARQGAGLSGLLDLAARTELIEQIVFMVRTVPEDGAERDQWLARHRQEHPSGRGPARMVNDELAATLTRASVRTETFVTIVAPETRLGRHAKEAGGGIDGRARVLTGLAGELEAQLRGAIGITAVTWLTSPQLALATRTGFAPGDRAGIIDALAARETDPQVHAEIPWAMAGPSGADPAPRHYSHDAWNSISASIILPVKGAAIGALAPVLTPTEPGERRSYTISYPILSQSAAQRASATSEWAADIGEELRTRAKVKARTKTADEAEKVRRLDAKLARGNCLTRPYAVCTVTIPKTAAAAEAGRRLDASVRRAGFAPLRLDLAQDVAFAAATIPLGIALSRKPD